MRTSWRCAACGRSGELLLAADFDGALVHAYANRRHHDADPLCPMRSVTVVFEPAKVLTAGEEFWL